MLPTRAYYQNQRFVFHQTPLKLCISLQTLLPFMFKAESLVRILFIAPKSRVTTSRDRISFSQAFIMAFFLRPEFSLIMPAFIARDHIILARSLHDPTCTLRNWL